MKADGLILLGYGDYLRLPRASWRSWWSRARTSCAGARCCRGSPGVSIGCDNFHGGQLVGEHLLGLRSPPASPSSAMRRRHYPEFFARYRGCGVALHDARRGDGPGVAGRCRELRRSRLRRARRRCSRAAKPFDAVFAASDLIAIGAMRALREHGLRMPEDVAVVGFDDIPMARFANPPLTTVYQNTARAGELLVEACCEQIQRRAGGEPDDSGESDRAEVEWGGRDRGGRGLMSGEEDVLKLVVTRNEALGTSRELLAKIRGDGPLDLDPQRRVRRVVEIIGAVGEDACRATGLRL